MKRLWWVAVLLTSPALATQVALTSMRCPLDGTAIRVHEKLTSDVLGGWDSDLARYSSQGQWRTYALATCPLSLLTLYGTDFARIPKEELARVTPVLSPWQNRYKDAETIPHWERYEIAAAVYRALGKPHHQLGELYLQGSWTARDIAVGVFVGLQGPQAARALLDSGDQELAKDLDGATRKIVLHNLARIAHRGGFNEERDHRLRQFAEMDDLSPRERQVLREFRQAVHVVEPRLQDQAIEEFTLALKTDDLDEESRLRTTYVLADLYRRRGRTEEASAGYASVVASITSPDEVRELAAWLGTALTKQ